MSEQTIETSVIRLTADETRAIVKAAAANGKPVSDYRCCGLVDLGIMKLVEIPARDFSKEVAESWKKIRRAAALDDESSVRAALRDLDDFQRRAKLKDKGYTLTSLGKEVARGVVVKINRQFSKVSC